MRSSRMLVAALAVLGVHAVPAAAAPCAGFTDVEDTAIYCGAAEWLKNRSVTLGCTTTPLAYCPDSLVTRASMALFMKRLGDALTPVVLHKEALFNNVVVASPVGGQLLCETADYTVTGFPRTARFNASVWGHPNQGPSWLVGWWKYSTDQGANWSNVGNFGVDQFYGRDWADYAQVAGFPVLAPPLALGVDTTYRFAIFVSGNSQQYEFNPLVCQLEVTITGRTGTTSPYDVQ